MKVLMIMLLCGWGEGAQCTIEDPVLVTMEKCREQQKLYSDIKDHVQVQCIKQACI